MREEIEAAVHFVGRVIISSNADPVTSFSEFKTELSKVMEEKFKGHWHDDSPGKGQGYRSIRIHPTEPVDPLLNKAALQSQFSVTHLRIPIELTVWVDPKDVTCRFGDLKSTYCTVLKDEDNQAGTLDVDELLENAKALYSRQQHFIIVDGPHLSDIPFVGSSNDLFGYGMQVNGMDSSYLYPSYTMYTPWHADSMMDGSTPPPLPYGPPLGLNTTPRKNGKNGHFRKGSSSAGRGSKHHHHHTPPHHQHHHNNGDYSNQNHAGNNTNNHNGNMSGSTTPNGSSISNGRNQANNRFQLVKGTKNYHQFYSPPPHSHFSPMQQQKYHQEQQQTSSKRRLYSDSDKDAK